MNIYTKYVLNNLLRKRKQTLFSLFCISVSSAIVLADFAVLNGIEAQLKKAINQVMSGQLTVYCTDNESINILESQLTEQKVFEWSEADREILGSDIPLDISQRLRIGSIISYEEETSYVHFHALEEEHLQKVAQMLTFPQGRMAEREQEIVISEKLAGDLRCSIGDTVLLVANNLYDYMSDAIGVVSGVFEERGIAIFLSHNGFMPYPAGRELVGIGEGEYLEFVINPAGNRDFTPRETSALQKRLRQSHPELKTASWDKTVPLLHSIVTIWKGGGLITQVVFLLFSLIILITLTSLIVHSRRKEFGTLLAIGFTWRRVKILVCAEYVLLACLAVLLGFAGVELICATQNSGLSIASKDLQSALMTDRLFLFLTGKDLLHVMTLFVSVTLLSALISVWRMQKTNIQSLLKD